MPRGLTVLELYATDTRRGTHGAGGTMSKGKGTNYTSKKQIVGSGQTQQHVSHRRRLLTSTKTTSNGENAASGQATCTRVTQARSRPPKSTTNPKAFAGNKRARSTSTARTQRGPNKKKPKVHYTGCHQHNKACRPSKVELPEVLGPASETSAKHSARHRDGRLSKACARCIWLQHKAKWQSQLGWFLTRPDTCEESGKRKRRQSTPLRVRWLSERSPTIGGTWGLGCVICRFALDRVTREGRLPKNVRQKFSTKWARFEINTPSCMQTSAFLQHTETAVHRQALRLWRCADTPVAEMLIDKRDLDLMKGRVPEPGDWLLAWRAVMNPQSFRSTEAFAQTNHYIQMRDDRALLRRTFANMVTVMATVVRRQKYHELSKATTCSLILDDRSEFRLLRYTCDSVGQEAETASWSRSGTKFAKSTIFAVFD